MFVFPQRSAVFTMNFRTDERILEPQVTFHSATIIAVRDTKSNVLTPPMGTVVARGFISDNACNACATHSVPARVLIGSWDIAIALSNAELICLATVRATNFHKMSPATTPRKTPLCFVNLPRLMTLTTTSGTCAPANCSHLCEQRGPSSGRM